MSKRNFGILMPISSLPSDEGIGTLGDKAYKFVDYLAASNAKIWQILPLNTTNYGDSPYQSCSSNALNYYFIDLKYLVADKLLLESEVKESDLFTTLRRVDYGKLFNNKTLLLRKAFARFKQDKEFSDFVASGEYYDFSIFMAIKEKYSHRAWVEWDEEFRVYNEERVRAFAKNNENDILFWQFTQFIFLKQWKKLKEYANKKGILIMGDIPLYIAYDSVEVWKYGNKLFKMDDNRVPLGVAGCPPDIFSEDGQLWGNPVYDWKKMEQDGYSWWNKRIQDCFKHCDILRIDHFRGFDRYYEIPFGNKTARYGKWVDGPKEKFFEDKQSLNIVAEDLGVVDDSLIKFLKNVGYPCMKVLLFAFDGSPDNEHKPSNFTENFVCYTGTHDNMPLKQHIQDLSECEFKVYKQDLINECQKVGIVADTSNFVAICESVIKLGFESIARTVIIPYGDLLALGGESRINFPSTVSTANWSWRFLEEEFTDSMKERLKKLATESNRI